MLKKGFVDVQSQGCDVKFKSIIKNTQPKLSSSPALVVRRFLSLKPAPRQRERHFVPRRAFNTFKSRGAAASKKRGKLEFRSLVRFFSSRSRRVARERAAVIFLSTYFPPPPARNKR